MSELKTIKVTVDVFESLERMKFLTLSKSYDKMFRKMLPMMREISHKYFATIGDEATEVE